MMTIGTYNADAILGVMPALAVEIAGLIGLDDTIKMLGVLGGKRRFFSKTLLGDQRLVAAIGEHNVERLIDLFEHQHIELPLLSSVERLLRNNALRADFDAGMSMDDIVDRYGVTQRRARHILKSSASTAPRRSTPPPRDPHTIDLFTGLTATEQAQSGAPA